MRNSNNRTPAEEAQQRDRVDMNETLRRQREVDVDTFTKQRLDYLYERNDVAANALYEGEDEHRKDSGGHSDELSDLGKSKESDESEEWTGA